MLMKVLCYFMLASTAYGWINVHEQLVGRVIHFESLRVRAEYITVSGTHDGSYRYYMILTSYAETEVSYKEHSSFLIRSCATDHVCIESVKTDYRNRYWAAGYPNDEPRETILLTHENYPDGNTDIHFKIECMDDTLTECKIVPRRFPSLFVVHEWQEGWNTPGRYFATLGASTNQYYKWNIHAPDPTEQEEEFFRMNNELENAAHQYTEAVSIGISDTKTTTQSIGYSVSMEVESAFKKFSASSESSISQSWQNEESSTYSQTTTTTIKINVPAFTYVVAYQLVGKYNKQFDVGSQAYRITSIDETGKKTDMFVANVNEIDVASLMQSGAATSRAGAPTPSGKAKERKERKPESKERYDQRIYHHHDHYHHGDKKEL